MTLLIQSFNSGRDRTVYDSLGDWKVVYEIGQVVWIIFGLGYIFMLINMIADILRKRGRGAAKRIRRGQKVMTTRILQELVNSKTKVRWSVLSLFC